MYQISQTWRFIKSPSATLSSMNSVPLYSSSRLSNLDLKIKYKLFFFILIEDLGPPSNSLVFFLLIPVKKLQTLSIQIDMWNFRNPCMKMSVRSGSWCTDSSHFLWSSPKFLKGVCLMILSWLRLTFGGVAFFPPLPHRLIGKTD